MKTRTALGESQNLYDETPKYFEILLPSTVDSQNKQHVKNLKIAWNNYRP